MGVNGNEFRLDVEVIRLYGMRRGWRNGGRTRARRLLVCLSDGRTAYLELRGFMAEEGYAGGLRRGDLIRVTLSVDGSYDSEGRTFNNLIVKELDRLEYETGDSDDR